MNPTNSQPDMERLPDANAPQFNTAPLGGIAANMAPSAKPDFAPTMPDVAPIPGAAQEQLSNPETQTGPMQGAPTTSTPPILPVVQPVAQPVVAPADDTTALTATAPTTAADDDLIEKEWVTKAKQVVSATRGDPYAQAKQVAALMRDYVQKRYGKEVGKAPEDL